MAKSDSLAPMEDEKTENSLVNQRTFRLNTLNFEKQSVAFCQSAWRKWPRTKYLQVGDESFPANVGTKHSRQDTNAEKNVVFIVFYSLYYVYYFILKYLFFTIVAAFGKDLFSLKELELQLLFSFRWWWSGGGVVRIPFSSRIHSP